MDIDSNTCCHGIFDPKYSILKKKEGYMKIRSNEDWIKENSEYIAVKNDAYEIQEITQDDWNRMAKEAKKREEKRNDYYKHECNKIKKKTGVTKEEKEKEEEREEYYIKEKVMPKDLDRIGREVRERIWEENRTYDIYIDARSWGY